MDYPALRNWRFEEKRQTYAQRDTMLYALGLGFGEDPLDADQLSFVTEKALRAVPAMVSVLCSPGLWLADPRTGVKWVRAVHGEQDIRLLGTLPAEGEVVGRNEVVAIADKGEGRGALVRVRRRLLEADGSTGIAEVIQTLFLRDEGGFSASGQATSDPLETLPAFRPDRPADVAVDLATLPQAALIYRLSGDYTPLHSDPGVAAAAGFPRPILHGLCTFGMAYRAALAGLCAYRTDRIRRFAARFTAPVFPGETVRFEFWRDDETRLRLTASVPGRNAVVLSNGIVELNAETQ